MDKNPTIAKGFEWYDIGPGARFFDQLEGRIFANGCDHPVKIGFGHTPRRVEIIIIAPGVVRDPDLDALEGVTIGEE